VPFTVLLTEGFYRAVERPMLNLSRSVKKSLLT
jgi:hypothetical protein